MNAHSAKTVVEQLRGELEALRAPRGYLRAGLPHFPGLFGRDSLIAGWQVLREEPSFARAALLRLAALQGKRVRLRREEEPGKILHEYYERTQWCARFKKRRVVLRWGSPYFGTVDATPLWLVVLTAYVAQTGDAVLLERLWPNALRAYQWLTAFGDHNGDGFLDYESHNPNALAHHWWKDSNDFGDLAMPLAPVEAQGYAFAALEGFASLAEKLGDGRLAQEARARAEVLRDRCAEAYRMTGGFFAAAIDGRGQQVPWITSNPGHLLFTRMLAPNDASVVAKRLFAPDLWTRYGIRTHSTRDRLFDWQSYHRGSVWPHDNWFIWKGLRAIGDTAGAGRITEALLRTFHELGGRLPELYAVEPGTDRLTATLLVNGKPRAPGYPQAWASGALLDMLTAEDV